MLRDGYKIYEGLISRFKRIYYHLEHLEEQKTLLFIFGISLFIRILYVIIFPTIPSSDAAAYDALAIGLMKGEGYGGGTSSYWPPGQPFFLAVIYIFFGYNPQIAYVFEALISSLTCIIIYYIGKNVLNKSIGLASSLIAAFYPSFIVYTGSLYSETIFLFLFTLSMLGLLKTYEKPSAKSILITGISFGLAILVRPAVVGLIPFILIWIILSSKDVKNNFTRFIVVFLIAMVIVSPWVIRNYNVHHEFVLVSTNGGVNFWIGNNPNATGRYEATPMLETIHEMTDSEVERDKLFYEKGFQFIKENPSGALGLIFKKFAHFWGLPSAFINFYLTDTFVHPIPTWLFILMIPLTILPYIILLIFAILGIVFYQKWNVKAYLLVLPIIYYTGVHSIIFGSNRYHLQVIPFLIVFGAYGFCSIGRIRSEINVRDLRAKVKVAISFLLILILIVCWCYSTYYWAEMIMSNITNLLPQIFHH